MRAIGLKPVKPIEFSPTILLLVLGLTHLPAIELPQSTVQVMEVASAIQPTRADSLRYWVATLALMRTIFSAEGTLHREDPYRVRALSGELVPLSYAFKGHPYWTDKLIPCANTRAGRICSACTGAAQWHPDTWDAVRKRNAHRFWFKDEPEFSPRNQDLAMLYKMEEIGTLRLLWKGVTTVNGQVSVDRASFNRAIEKAAPVWASLPRHQGDDAGEYGQGARSHEVLWKVFQDELKKENDKWKNLP